jgi:3-methylfumaryl-CoA hydratase
MSTTLNLSHLQEWIGRTERVEDTVTPRLMREYTAMMDHETPQATAPLAMHWCLAPPAANTATLGPDGHPARGGFLPPVPLPRRMWAGGSLRLVDRLRCGDAVQRHSQITDVTTKEGRSGTLCFVTVTHEITSPRGLAIAEVQDIVYRDATAPASPGRPVSRPAPTWAIEKATDAVLLFRYSALTFNGHRIHYDRAYAMGEEHYPGLIVHGPLQATWLLEFAATIKHSAPTEFMFRGVQPLFNFMKFKLCAVDHEVGLKLWIETADGIPTMEATAKW